MPVASSCSGGGGQCVSGSCGPYWHPVAVVSGGCVGVETSQGLPCQCESMRMQERHASGVVRCEALLAWASVGPDEGIMQEFGLLVW